MAFLRKLAPLRLHSARFGQVRHLNSQLLKYSEEVLSAKSASAPIVALESTIITHGMPYPHNLETALQVEDIIRKRGATPATVAILGGELHIGLSEDQLKYLSQAKGVVKASRRDLAPVMAGDLDGATTVAGTIIAAELADIPVFATGGIGGVHRQGEQTLDVSADLTELGRSRTLVVCSGVKSILDIGRTLEYLETQGVCVCSFGESYEFPAFYTQSSGHRAPHRATNALEAAKIALASRTLQLRSGIVVAVPLPKEHAMDKAVIDAAIDRALEEAKSKGIRGKEVTPFILAAVADATAGASLAANIALIKNNAKVGADIAAELAKLRNVENFKNSSNIGVSRKFKEISPKCSRGIHTSCRTHVEMKEENQSTLIHGKNTDGPVLVIGGANVDRTYRVTEGEVQLDGSTHACKLDVCAGGVGRNMAEALWRMRGPGSVRLLTAVGDDADGNYLTGVTEGLLLDGCVVRGGRTASYAVVLDSRGECQLGLGDMSLHDHINIDLVDQHLQLLARSPLVVVDGNPPQSTIDHVLRLCHQLNKPVFFEPTDRRKALKTIHNKHPIQFASPNLNELRALARFIDPNCSIYHSNILDEITELAKTVSVFIDCIIVTVGAKGVVIFNKTKFQARFYPGNPLDKIVSVSGAGDCFSSGYIHGMLLGLPETQCVSIGFQAAAQALRTKNTVPNIFDIKTDLSAGAQYETLM